MKTASTIINEILSLQDEIEKERDLDVKNDLEKVLATLQWVMLEEKE